MNQNDFKLISREALYANCMQKRPEQQLDSYAEQK